MDKNTMMENLARKAHEKGAFNGTWLYAENGEIVSKGALGFRDAEDKRPMREDSVFELASITKQFTAAAVMLLVRDGLLSLEDEVTKYYPEIPYPGVTIRHLLTHTGGIPETYDDNLILRFYKEEKRIPGSDGVIRFLAEGGEKPRFAPGEKFEYTNGGYNLLAEIVEKVSGVPFEEFLRTNVFEPAGMYRTGVYHIWSDGIPHDNFVRNMVMEDGRHVLVADSDDRDVIAFDGLNGDDYVYTDIFDMLFWDRALREEKVLTLEEQMTMYTPGRLNDGSVSGGDGNRDGYGFGWGIVNDSEFGLIVHHSGGMPGLCTWFERFVDVDRVLVLLICRDAEDARAFNGFWNGMRKIARDQEPDPIVSIEDITVKNPDKSGWASFCGKYERREDTDFTIDEVFTKDGDLYARAIDEDGDALEFRLYPIGKNEFGRKGGMLELKFGDGCLMFGNVTCKKL